MREHRPSSVARDLLDSPAGTASSSQGAPASRNDATVRSPKSGPVFESQTTAQRRPIPARASSPGRSARTPGPKRMS